MGQDTAGNGDIIASAFLQTQLNDEGRIRSSREGILSMDPHFDRDPPFDRSHPVTVQKRLEFKLSTPRQLAMQMRSRLLVEVPTRHPSASVTEAVFSISFSLQLDTQKRPLL